MKSSTLLTALAIGFAIAAPALGQTVGPTDPAVSSTRDPNSAPPSARRHVVIEPAQRTRIHEYVTRERVPAVHVQERLAVGRRLPADVELRTVPADWGPSVSSYRYVYSNDHVYFVNPSDRTVVEELD